jgi:hypothetical protein
MSRFLPYSPEQGGAVPSNAKEVLGSDHLCSFVHEVVEQLELISFRKA